MALGSSAGGRAVAEEPTAYIVEVSDVTAKVGDHAVMRATLRVRDGYRILEPYNNRVIQLSSYDDGVVFERKMVPAQLQEGALVFAVGLRATKPGKFALDLSVAERGAVCNPRPDRKLRTATGFGEHLGY